MRVLVDLNRCQAYAQCCFLAPDVFKLKGREVVFYSSDVDDEHRRDVRRAAAACPVRAILTDDASDAATGAAR